MTLRPPRRPRAARSSEGTSEGWARCAPPFSFPPRDRLSFRRNADLPWGSPPPRGRGRADGTHLWRLCVGGGEASAGRGLPGQGGRNDATIPGDDRGEDHHPKARLVSLRRVQDKPAVRARQGYGVSQGPGRGDTSWCRGVYVARHAPLRSPRFGGAHEGGGQWKCYTRVGFRYQGGKQRSFLAFE